MYTFLHMAIFYAWFGSLKHTRRVLPYLLRQQQKHPRAFFDTEESQNERRS